MVPRIRVPMIVIAGALLGLIVLLATLQYSWLGQISDAERQRMRSILEARAAEFAKDFDQEVTRAYLLFQTDMGMGQSDEGERLAVRYDRWQATARFPRMIEGLYRVARADDGTLGLSRLDLASRRLEPVEWPASMADWPEQFGGRSETPVGGGIVFRRLTSPVWDRVPAIVVPMPVVMMYDGVTRPDMRISPQFAYTVLALDREYLTGDLLPALAAQHFRAAGERVEYQVAVVAPEAGSVVYHSNREFSPKPDAPVDTAADFFQVRTQDFAGVANEIRRYFTTFTAAPLSSTTTMMVPRLEPQHADGPGVSAKSGTKSAQRGTVVEGRFEMRAPMSIIVQQSGPSGSNASTAAAAAAVGGATARLTATSSPRWKLMVKHPSGPLEAAVVAARRRNLLVSSSILAVLAASVGLLVLSTRRAQDLARRQMEFVAAVSHELRTPLAVIRSAAENLADGVVKDDAQIRKYGDLVRNEGRRLTEMVEQILELAGLQSGQRGFALRPVGIAPLVRDIVDASASLIDEAGIAVEFSLAGDLPPVFGDEPALRRVFQNLIGNAVKYGASGRWIGIRARSLGRDVEITVADRGIGIAAAEQPKIFDPFYRAADVVAAQIQGAGLGLSLVKRIVEAHGGRISVKSTPGAGSEFTVVLPAVTESATAAAVNSQLPTPNSHGERLEGAR